MKIDNPLITGTLFFPDEYFDDKNITPAEMEYRRFFLKQVNVIIYPFYFLKS